MAMTLHRTRTAAAILGMAACATFGWLVGHRQAVPTRGDLADLALARAADTPAGWEAYRDRHPRGIAVPEAEGAITRLAARQPIEPPRREDPELVARLEGRLAQIRESVAKREKPPTAPEAAPDVEKPKVEAPAAAPPITIASDPRLIEPAERLPAGRGIDVDPADATRVLRWTVDGAILVSTDGGRAWKPCRTGTAGWSLDRLALRPDAQPRTVFIAAAGGTAALGLVSRDAGATWNPLPAPWGGDQPVERCTAQPAILTTDGMLIAAQRSGAAAVLWSSRDLGATWKHEREQEGFHTIAPLGAGGCLALFDAGDAAFAVSTDLGATRTPLPNSQNRFAGRPASWDWNAQGVMLFDPLHRGTVFIFDRRGRSTHLLMLAYPDVWDIQDRLLLRALAVDPRDPKQWFAASPALGLLRSDDGGVRWRACQIDRNVSAIAIRRVGNRTVVAATGRTTLVLDASAPVADLFTVDPTKVAERVP